MRRHLVDIFFEKGDNIITGRFIQSSIIWENTEFTVVQFEQLIKASRLYIWISLIRLIQLKSAPGETCNFAWLDVDSLETLWYMRYNFSMPRAVWVFGRIVTYPSFTMVFANASSLESKANAWRWCNKVHQGRRNSFVGATRCWSKTAQHGPSKIFLRG